MTDIETALAEALHDFGIDQMADCAESAAAILATEPMQAIARKAAIGAAVEAGEAKVVTVESLRGAMVSSRVYAGDMAASTAAARIIFAALGDDHECGLECSDSVIETDDLRGQR